MITKDELLNKKIGVVSLGCDKNRVDAEHMLADLKKAGFAFCSEAENAEIIIINTCAFIESARKESIDMILQMAQQKFEACEKLIVTGCLPQKNMEEVTESFKEVDKFVKIADNKNIVKIIYELYGLKYEKKTENTDVTETDNKYCFSRILTTPDHYAYIKIADGCNNCCSYCTIPSIRGKYKSVPIENLISEANELVDMGAREIILVAQDVTRYGEDLYKKNMLIELIHKLSEIDKLKWIRLLYCYPEKVTDELINEIASNDKVCKYIDIPLQHISTKILQSMHRQSTKESIIKLINKFRSLPIQIAIRTTFMVGFPGETRKDFMEMFEFNKQFKLDNVGAFTYSREEGTPSASLKKQVPEFIKNFRYRKLMKLLKKNASENNRYFIGQELSVVCEGKIENSNVYFGRTEYQAPDIDGVTYFYSDKKITIGKVYKIKITDSYQYDLKGETI